MLIIWGISWMFSSRYVGMFYTDAKIEHLKQESGKQKTWHWESRGLYSTTPKKPVYDFRKYVINMATILHCLAKIHA